jgi:hypothetical protein
MQSWGSGAKAPFERTTPLAAGWADAAWSTSPAPAGLPIATLEVELALRSPLLAGRDSLPEMPPDSLRAGARRADDHAPTDRVRRGRRSRSFNLTPKTTTCVALSASRPDPQ